MNDDLQRSLARGIEWLVSRQGTDGGWHSTTYGQLKDGAAITTLVLDALSRAPAETRQKHLPAIQKAYAFLDRGLAKSGTISSPDGSLDFPTYAAALWLTAHNRLWRSDEGSSVVDYLLEAQVAEARGFDPQSPSYGGWDFLGSKDAKGITTGTNISVTRYVLEALALELRRRETGGLPNSAIRQITTVTQRALGYCLRCQQPDGGFAFTCEPASLNNKAAYADEELKEPRPYATATCDGIQALLACGLAPDDERIAKAVAWLVKRPSLELVPGFEGLPAEAGWQRGLRYYYYAGLAAVLPHFSADQSTLRRAALVKHVVGLQTKDGNWVNESDRMRENDPLIATAFSITALAKCAAD